MTHSQSRRDDIDLMSYNTPTGLNMPPTKIYNHLTPSGSSIVLHKES